MFSERQVEMNGLVIIRNRLLGHKSTRHEDASGQKHVVSNRMIQASQ